MGLLLYSVKITGYFTALSLDAVKGATVESGLGSTAPGSTAPYAAMGNMYFESMESFQNSFGPNAEAIMADAPNYTNAEPTVQISEVII